mmetsp:Transcript_56790/g.176628  ORF Transcript_56790/g.176628 Transcript_56790/m.176628 type:complete len:410 (+) Transcript_56790:467-1696(+)
MRVEPRGGDDRGTPTQREHSLWQLLRAEPHEVLRVQRADERTGAGEDVRVQPEVASELLGGVDLPEILDGGCHAVELLEVQLHAFACSPGCHHDGAVPPRTNTSSEHTAVRLGIVIELLVQVPRKGCGLVGRMRLLLLGALGSATSPKRGLAGNRGGHRACFPDAFIMPQDGRHEPLEAQVARLLGGVVSHDDALPAGCADLGVLSSGTLEPRMSSRACRSVVPRGLLHQRPRRDVRLNEVRAGRQRPLQSPPGVHGVRPPQPVREALAEVRGGHLGIAFDTLGWAVLGCRRSIADDGHVAGGPLGGVGHTRRMQLGHRCVILPRDGLRGGRRQVRRVLRRSEWRKRSRLLRPWLRQHRWPKRRSGRSSLRQRPRLGRVRRHLGAQAMLRAGGCEWGRPRNDARRTGVA